MTEKFIKEQNDVIDDLDRVQRTLSPLADSFRDVGNDKMADTLDLVCGILKHDSEVLRRSSGEQITENLRNTEHACFSMVAGVLAAIARFSGETPPGEAIPTDGEVTLDGAKDRFGRFLDVACHVDDFDTSREQAFRWILTGIGDAPC